MSKSKLVKNYSLHFSFELSDKAHKRSKYSVFLVAKCTLAGVQLTTLRDKLIRATLWLFQVLYLCTIRASVIV